MCGIDSIVRFSIIRSSIPLSTQRNHDPMTLADLLNLVPVYVLVLVRIGAMMIFAPMLGSARIPRRVKAMLAMILALVVTPSVAAPAALPQTTWELALGMSGEILFGLAMGMVLSFTFIAAQWAGEMAGQQMGFSMSQVFDPQFGQQGSPIGDLFYMMALVVFLVVRGHHAMFHGLRDSFDHLPLLSVGVSAPLLDLMIDLFTAATSLAFQLAAPLLVTMLILDLSLGFISKTVPQLNVMTAGMSLRMIVGIIIVIVGLVLTNEVMSRALLEGMNTVRLAWTSPELIKS